jgi:hypothetical protein
MLHRLLASTRSLYVSPIILNPRMRALRTPLLINLGLVPRLTPRLRAVLARELTRPRRKHCLHYPHWFLCSSRQASAPYVVVRGYQYYGPPGVVASGCRQEIERTPILNPPGFPFSSRRGVPWPEANILRLSVTFQRLTNSRAFPSSH